MASRDDTSSSEVDNAVRASDAERDTVISQLGQHFQDGRLSQDEHEQRVASALTARTRHELAVLVTDLPAEQPRPARVPSARLSFPRLRQAVLAAVIVTFLISGNWSHGRDGNWAFAPFAIAWLVLSVAVIRTRTAGRRRQWR